MKKVVIGVLGPTLDNGFDAGRWNIWRPSVSLFQHNDLLIDRFEILYQQRFSKLAKQVIADIGTVSPETEVRKHVIEFADAWNLEEVYGALYEFSRGYDFDTEREEYLIHISTGTHVVQISLFLLTESHHLPGKLIQTSPPPRRDMGDPGRYTLIDLDLSKYDRIAQRFYHERDESLFFLKSGIDTQNERFNRLMEQIEHVAVHSDLPIVLSGPTGSGKSQMARRIYELKKLRRQISGEFVEVNCATVRGDAAMSTLFGHKKGAFTGAVQNRDGLLLRADGGLLFLDEIAEMGLDEQTMLLRAIEEKTFLPLGSDREVQSHFQLICGTNRDLRQQVQKGNFREDLLARISLWAFEMPGLAQRRDDIEPNIYYELNQQMKRTGRNVCFNKEALNRYLDFAKSPSALWCYNFRDLNASIARMATMSPSGRITVEVVLEEIERLKTAWTYDRNQTDAADLVPLLGEDALHSLDRFDRVQLEDVVRVCRNSRSMSEAGRSLFSISRQKRKASNDADRLRKYLAKFGIQWRDIASLGD